MKKIEKQIITGIQTDLEQPHNKLNTLFIMNDLTDYELNVICEMSLLSLEISKIFEKFGIAILSEGFSSIDRMINLVMFQDFSYNIAVSYIKSLNIILEETLELLFAEFEISEAKSNELQNIIDMLADFENKSEFLDTKIEIIEELKNETVIPVKKKKDGLKIPENISELDGRFKNIGKDSLEFINDFIVETEEFIQLSEDKLLCLEKNPDNPEAINSIFRAVHSIKGSAGFMNFIEISTVAHWAESLLDKCRSHELKITDEIIDTLLKSIDRIKLLMFNLLLRVNFLLGKEKEYELKEIYIDSILEMIKEQLEGKKNEQTQQNSKKNISNIEYVKKADVKEIQAENRSGGADLQTDSIRIPIKKVENAGDMIGELLIAVSLLKQTDGIKNNSDKSVFEKLHNVEMITDLLQTSILKMRMFPIKSVYDKLNRQVRDLVVKSQKKINFITIGAETEIDKGIIDEIYSPLMHLMRNSIDHGIEKNERRVEKNKPEIGTIELKTENRGDKIVISISDDGAGLNAEKIKIKAIEKNLISESNNLTDSEIFKLIFLPGFSTAEKITDISGRGVGMDVVKNSVEKLSGSIDIESKKDKGSKFEISLPLSASVVNGIITRVGKSRFIFPILKIKYTLVPENGDVKMVFENKAPFIIFKNMSAPVICLSEFYELGISKIKLEDKIVLVVEYENKIYGLAVDELIAKEKIVTRKLSGSFENICGVKAGAILGDGGIGLIIEPNDIIKEFNLQKCI